MRRLYAPCISFDRCGRAVYQFIFFYQHYQQQRVLNNQKMFDVVMSEKMRALYMQAQDWSTPVQLDIHDDRLSGDYKKCQSFC